MSTKSLKVIVVGEAGVGKTSLIQRYVHDTFEDRARKDVRVQDVEDDEDVLVADFVEKRVMVADKEMTVSFWDQPTSAPPPPSFYAGTHGCVLVFSTVDADSLHKLESWYECVKTHCFHQQCPLPPVVIAENKIDLIDQSVVDAEAVEKAAKQFKLRLYRTSAKQGHQVKPLFDYIAAKAVKYEAEYKAILEANDQKGRATRTPSAASWTLPPSSSQDKLDKQASEPSKRRTGGVKPLFNKNKCPVM